MPSCRLEQLVALGTVFGFQHGAAGNNHVVALLVELDDLEFEFLAFQVRGVAHRTDVDQGAGQERADGPTSTVKPPLTLPLMTPLTMAVFSKASSRTIQISARLAFSRDRRVKPKPSSMASRAT
jgi:hypothetical protein